MKISMRIIPIRKYNMDDFANLPCATQLLQSSAKLANVRNWR